MHCISMFTFTKSSTKKENATTTDSLIEEGKKISLKLGDNILSLNENYQWISEKGDLDIAEDKIFELLNHNEIITKEALLLKKQLVIMQGECETANKLKKVTMDMLAAEREETNKLRREIEGYQEELRKCYKMIIELRKLVPPES